MKVSILIYTMAERVNEPVGAPPVETTSRGMFDFMKKDEVEKPIKKETFASEFDQKVQVSDPVEAEYQDALETKFGATPEEAEYKDEEKRQGANPLETTDHSLFDLIQNDSENKIPVTEETFGSDFDHKAPVSEPAEYKDQDEKKHGTVVEMLRSYSSSDEEGDDEEKKQRKKEKKGLKEKLVEKLPGHKDDEVVEDSHVPIEKPHVQEAVYSEPPQQEEEPEKKSFLDKIKDKLPGHSKTEDSHDEAVPVSVEPVVKGEEEDKKGFMDKIKDKIPGLSSSKTSDEKDDHVDK